MEKASIEGSPSETPPAMVAAPAMPVEHNVYEPHRSDMRQLVEDKIKELTDEANASLFAAVVQLLVKPKFQSCFAAVAKVLNKKEIAASKEAQASLDKEWDKLLNKKTWDQERVTECRRVVDEARRKGEKVHIGRIFEICTLKGSELRFSGWVTRGGLLKREQNGLTANSLFLFLAFSLRFLELALSYRVASGEMRFLELAFLSLVCIILTDFCARRISGTKTDYS